MICTDSTLPDQPLALTPLGLLLPNIKFPNEGDSFGQSDPGPREDTHAPQPGGIVIVAVLSGLSGAIMGLIFGGYLTAALAVLISVPLGIAVGIWSRNLRN